MPDAPTDVQLVERAANGDGRAYDELLQRHERRIYNLAYRMLGDREDARDAAQDAFVAAYRRLDTFRGDAAFSTWLYRVAVNACYDALRTRARTPLPAEMAEDEVATAPDPAETAGMAIDVQRALAQISDEFRSVVILHDIQDQPYDEIAAILEIPIGTVKSRLHRGRAMLGALLQGTSSPHQPSEGP